MRKRLELGVITLSIAGLVGCSNLPGNSQQQGAVIGGASGAAIGAAAAHNHALGAIIGGAVGAAGGYVVGANKDKILGKDSQSASEAERNAQQTPATVEQARTAPTADINNDGYVTLDEVIAMRQAGLTDQQMVDKLRATRQVFQLTEDQRRYLLERGVSQYVVDQMASLNQQQEPQVLTPTPPNAVVGRPAPIY
jgi:hypothetical protein